MIMINGEYLRIVPVNDVVNLVYNILYCKLLKVCFSICFIYVNLDCIETK